MSISSIETQFLSHLHFECAALHFDDDDERQSMKPYNTAAAAADDDNGDNGWR